MSKTNTCITCGKRLPLEDFSIRGNTKKLNRECIACRQSANKLWYDEDRAEWFRKYYDKNRERIKEYQKEYRNKNLEHRKEYEKEYRENHKNSRKEYQREYYINNKKRSS